MKVAIVGYRYYNNYIYFKQKVDEWIQENGSIESIVSGGASGVDTLAERYADEHNIKKIIFPVTKEEWNKFGLAAGPLRNDKIIKELEKDMSICHVIAFPSKKSKGTYDTIKKVKDKQIPITIYDV